LRSGYGRYDPAEKGRGKRAGKGLEKSYRTDLKQRQTILYLDDYYIKGIFNTKTFQ